MMNLTASCALTELPASSNGGAKAETPITPGNTDTGTGEAYVNDYVQFGRIYQVKLGAGDRAQRIIDDVLKLAIFSPISSMFISFLRLAFSSSSMSLKDLAIFLATVSPTKRMGKCSFIPS